MNMKKALCLFAAVAGIIALGGCFTAGSDDTPEWKFAIVSDTNGNPEALKAIASDIVANNCEIVLATGNISDGKGGMNEFKKDFASVLEKNIPVYNIRGTLESSNDEAVLKTYIENSRTIAPVPDNGPEGEKGLSYSFVRKNALFIGLDPFVKDCRVNSYWMTTEIQESATKHVFVYSSLSAFFMKDKQSLASYPMLRDIFWNSMLKSDVPVYFGGNEKFYDRAWAYGTGSDAMHHVVCGPAAATPAKWNGVYQEKSLIEREAQDRKNNGYMLVTVYGSDARIEWKAVSEENGKKVFKTIDSFSVDSTR